jgi:hypothetical protein
MVNGLLPHLMGEQGKEVKKLEEQKEELIDISKFLLRYFEPDRFVKVMMTREQYDDIEHAIAEVKGEKE